MVVSGLPDLTGKWKQAFTVLTPVDFGQSVFTGKAATPKQWVGRSNRLGNVCLQPMDGFPSIFIIFFSNLFVQETIARLSLS